MHKVGKLSFANKYKKIFLIFVVLILGVSLRFFFSSLGHNYDMESYKIVGEIVDSGQNVYAATHRYNYGPVWFWILGFLHEDNISIQELHFRVTFILTLFDIFLSIILYKVFGFLSFLIFFLNPISIFISGFHGQFDNFAILVGFISVLLFHKYKISNKLNYFYFSTVFLGISLAIKHVLFLFPLWVFFWEKNRKTKLLSLFIPFFIFLLFFIPYVNEISFKGILDNVLLYRSFNNAPFFNFILPEFIKHIFISPFFFFLFILTFLGLLIAKNSFNAIEKFLIYLIVVVIFSSAITNQYLVIPLLFISVYPNIIFYLFSILGFLQISMNPHSQVISFGLETVDKILVRFTSYEYLVLLLFLGFLLFVFKIKIFSKVTLSFLVNTSRYIYKNIF